MIKVFIYGEEFTCSKAVKGNDYIKLYDDNGGEIASFTGICDFSGFTIEGGEWSTPQPTVQEDIMSMLVDTEYRLTLLETGVK